MKKFIKEMLSEYGPNGSVPSSKRVMGAVTLITALCCMIYLTCVDRGTMVVENLLQTAMIMATSLLGISSVTGIWKGNSMTVNDKPNNQTQSPEPNKPKEPKETL